MPYRARNRPRMSLGEIQAVSPPGKTSPLCLDGVATEVLRGRA